MEAADIRALVRYNRIVLERYERALRRLGWRAITRNRNTGHLSMKDTYLHIVQVADGWLNYVVPGRVDAMEERPDPYALGDWRAIRRWTSGVWKQIEGRTLRLTSRGMKRPVKAPWMPGEYTVQDAYLQVTFEQAHHLGELIAMFWQIERSPPEMTWIVTRNRAKRAAP
jgi:uncharacterized damage-inducible protein DinB